MFLARPIFGDLCINYNSRYDLPWSLNVDNRPSRQTDKIKDVDNPKSQYHAWLEESDAQEYPREQIISKLLEGNEDFSHLKQFRETFKKSRRNKKKTPKPLEQVGYDDSTDDSDLADNYEVKSISSRSSEDSLNQIPEYRPPDILTYPQKVDKLFALLAGLRWCDRDEHIMQPRQLNRIDCSELRWLMPVMMKISDELFTAIHSTTGALDDMEVEQKYNFLFHIIAKGQQYYFSCITDPEFCTFLLPNNFQPLCTYIMKKFCIRDIAELLNWA